jgi:hypothetical protein
MRNKSEIRNPKSERSPKSEARRRHLKPAAVAAHDSRAFRISGFGFDSDFGFAAAALLDLRSVMVMHTPHPGPLPVEGRGGPNRASQARGHMSRRSDVPGRTPERKHAAQRLGPVCSPRRASLSPQRGEGRGEGCDRAGTQETGGAS